MPALAAGVRAGLPLTSRPVFSKVVVANRGEIAIRVTRALEELGIASVAIYSEPDRDAPHARRASEAYLIGPGPPAQSYLAGERILEIARRSGAEAIHPGYGFLAENAAFARDCEREGLVWIGPPPEALEAMGSKIRARELMRAAGVPIVPGTTEPIATAAEAAELAEREIGYPLAIKAAGGGGGKGFRVAHGPDELEAAFAGASGKGLRYFSDATVYLERYLEDPRHIEVQVLADGHGQVIHLGERDCSVQRRHQKLVEESPAPAVDAELREQIGRVGVEAARAARYRSAGTVEGLLADGVFYFLEMNTRVQVEHSVTEMVTGIDIVREQLLVASGEPLSYTQDQVRLHGHAIECRLNAEDAASGFAPSPGRISAYREPAGPGVRVDSGVESGSEVSPLYDPLIAKLIVWDSDRERATARMLRALGEFRVEGPATLLPFHLALLSSEQWRRGETCRDLVEDRQWLAGTRPAGRSLDGAAAAPAEPGVERTYAVEVSGRRFDVRVVAPPGAGAPGPAAIAPARRPRREGSRQMDGEALLSPLGGTVLRVAVEAGAVVERGALICVIEAMKMENEITAHRDGTVAELTVAGGAAVASGDPIAVIR